MEYNFTKFKKDVSEIEMWLTKEFSNIRTGSASISVIDDVKIDNYGSSTPINQVANITKEDAKTIRISPWDPSQIKSIEKAMMEASLGISVAVDDKGVRLSFPDLTSERRQDFVKIAKDKLEQARVSLRGERDKVWGDVQLKEKEGEISQDEKFQLKDEMQEAIDDMGKVLLGLFEKKEKEIMG